MNDRKRQKIRRLVQEIQIVIDHAVEFEEKYKDQIETLHPNYRESAQNLLHYRALRRHDITKMQKMLGNLGLSRFAKAEGHVMRSLRTNQQILKSFLETRSIKISRANVSIKKSNRLQRRNAKELLGFRSKGRRTRIMVTLPAEAASEPAIADSLVRAGMNCARINCAHDGPEMWKLMIDHLREASGRHHKNVKIAMDLGGPKIRTGPMKPGPQIVKLTPDRDARGLVLHPAVAWVSKMPLPEETGVYLPLASGQEPNLKAGTKLFLRDTRGKDRELIVQQGDDSGYWVYAFDTTYLETGTELFLDKSYTELLGALGELPPIEQRLLLKAGDKFEIVRDQVAGEPAEFDESGNLLRMARISCTAPEVFDSVKEGDPIRFDDGKIEGVIETLDSDRMIIRITRTKQTGGKLRADKGINFPHSELDIRGLTQKDRQDLAFIVEHADVVNLSFVNEARDVRDLLEELERLGALHKIGIILKIETQWGYNNLTEILLEAMRTYPVGVMIARGDLAVEVGWDNVGRVQEEILSLCRAAHVTDIWATQVLETLAKKGLPSRAEITDATMAQRADCVMLNKGPYILHAIGLLDRILKDMEPYWDKRTPMLPRMSEADIHPGTWTDAFAKN